MLLLDAVRAAAAQHVATVKYLHELLVLWIHLGRLNLFVAHRTLALPAKLLDKLLELLQCLLQRIAAPGGGSITYGLRCRAHLAPLCMGATHLVEEGGERVLHVPAIKTGLGQKLPMSFRSARIVSLSKLGSHGGANEQRLLDYACTHASIAREARAEVGIHTLSMQTRTHITQNVIYETRPILKFQEKR